MNYYPVIIPTLNRYEHFKRCVESLSLNTHAEKTELVIGLDYPPSEKYVEGYNKIKAFIPTISGFAKVTVFEHTSNLGPSKNIRELREYAFSKYDAVISTEDDNEFSPCFLDYMNKALEKFRDNSTVESVTGFNNAQYYSITTQKIYLSPTGSYWGVGRWRSKRNMLSYDENFEKDILFSFRKSYKVFSVFPAILNMLIEMYKTHSSWGDVKVSCKNVIEGRFQIRPRISMVRNWGNDGTGLHGGFDPQFEAQKILTDEYFDFDDIEITVEKKVYRKLFFSLLSTNKIKAYLQILRIAYRYIVFRIINIK